VVRWRHEVPHARRATADKKAGERNDAESLWRASEAGNQPPRSETRSKIDVGVNYLLAFSLLFA